MKVGVVNVSISTPHISVRLLVLLGIGVASSALAEGLIKIIWWLSYPAWGGGRE